MRGRCERTGRDETYKGGWRWPHQRGRASPLGRGSGPGRVKRSRAQACIFRLTYRPPQQKPTAPTLSLGISTSKPSSRIPHSRRRVFFDGLDKRLDLWLGHCCSVSSLKGTRATRHAPASRFEINHGPSAAAVLAVSAALDTTVACAWTRLFGTIVWKVRDLTLTVGAHGKHARSTARG